MLRRSTRPPEQTPKQKLAMLVRSFRSPSRPPLGALLTGISAQELRDRAKPFTPRQVLDDAFALYLQAISTLRRATDAQREVLRGVSLDLLVQLSELALEADDIALELERMSKTRGTAVTEAQAALRAVSAKALAVREQARRTIERVSGDDAAAHEQVRNAATASAGSGTLVEGLRHLASLAHRLIEAEDPSTRQRAALLGLDDAYAKQLGALARELDLAERAVWRLSSEDDGPEARLREMLGSTLAMMTIVVEAFDSAHDLDTTLPVLRPKFTQRAVLRRHSRLPPPSTRPDPAHPKATSTAPTGAVRSESPPSTTAAYHGGLGKR